MRIFGRHKVTMTSTPSRTAAASVAESEGMADLADHLDEAPLPELDRTDEMPIFRDSARISVVPPLTAASAASPAAASPLVSVGLDDEDGPDDEGDSDVFVCRRSSPEISADEMAAAAAAAAANVTLFVYGWDNVEPGPLSWVFPSLRAALEAVRTMRNAVEWSICSGADWTDINAARAKGAVLVEQNT
jgi:hypothetical protein